MTPWIASLWSRLLAAGRAVAASAARCRWRPGAGRKVDGSADPAASALSDLGTDTGQSMARSARAEQLGRAFAGLTLPGLKAAGLRLPRLSLPGGLRPWITCLSLGFVLAALLGHGRQLLQLSLDAQGWWWLLLAVGLQGLSLLVNGLAWVVILRWRGLRPRPAPLVSLYVSSNLRKYLPGGIWHLAARVQALRQEGAPFQDGPTGTAQALVATLLDPLLAAVAALALVPLGGWQNGLAVLCLLPLLLLHPRWLQPLLLRLERQRARQLGLSQSLEQELAAGETGAAALPAIWPWGPLLVELLFVLLRFAGFWACVWAFDLQLSLDVWTWLAGFALAWTVGLVVPGAPGGLGVFEAVLLLRLAVELPQASLLAVALSYRLVVTLADVLTAALVGADERLAVSGRSSQ
jgi:hypothetical protein